MVLACLGLTSVRGQITVELDFGKDFYIANETMLASVRVTNFSGQTLRFGTDNHWLMFAVEGQNGFLVDQRGTPNVTGVFEVPNGSRGTRRVNLAPYYEMTTPGRYMVTATVICQQVKEVLKQSLGMAQVGQSKMICQQPDFMLVMVGQQLQQ